MRYPALKLLMVLHYALALVVGWAAFVFAEHRVDSWWASAIAAGVALGVMALADLIRLVTNIEANTRSMRSAPAAGFPGAAPSRAVTPASSNSAADAVEGLFDRLDAAADRMVDRISGK